VSELGEEISIAASLAEVWDYHFDSRGWPLWVDGFQAVVASEGYPREGGSLRWRSTPAGRGEVSERVLEHSPRTLHRIAFSDPQTEGELRTSFQIQGDGTRVEQRLSYRLLGGGPFGWATDRLFIRSQQRRSIQRSLLRLKHEVEEIARVSA
jgi:uncharacterized membrane protein